MGKPAKDARVSTAATQQNQLIGQTVSDQIFHFLHACHASAWDEAGRPADAAANHLQAGVIFQGAIAGALAFAMSGRLDASELREKTIFVIDTILPQLEMQRAGLSHPAGQA